MQLYTDFAGEDYICAKTHLIYPNKQHQYGPFLRMFLWEVTKETEIQIEAGFCITATRTFSLCYSTRQPLGFCTNRGSNE